MDNAAIRDAVAADWTAWHRMWLANCAHHGVTTTEVEVHELWRRILDPAHPVAALVCGGPRGDLVGFATYVVHPHTFSSRMVGYLEDLWVEPSARGGGAGRRMIEALAGRGRERGWRRLYWHCDADNVAARALYDRIARLTKHVRYDIALT